MKILIAHNYYQQAGGEDQVVANELQLLSSYGHQIKLFFVQNKNILPTQSIKIAWQTAYSEESKLKIALEIEKCKPDIVHIHNFFPLLTPSVYDACQESDVPVVQTLHNYRIICAAGLLLRNGKVCELCVHGSAYQAVFYGCYRNSRLGSLAVARMIDFHRKRKTWLNKTVHYLSLTQFAKEKFVEAGLPAERISTKPNFYNSKFEGSAEWNNRSGALFVGRLSIEKGVHTLIEAWKNIKIPLRIAGEGPLTKDTFKRRTSNIALLGNISSEQVSAEMHQALFLVMPSVWFEGFPMVLVEAFFHGLPVIVSRLGSMAEIVEDGATGLHFEPGNPNDLAAKVQWMNDHPEQCRCMGENARKVYEEKYTPERNYTMLMDIYQQAIDERKRRAG